MTYSVIGFDSAARELGVAGCSFNYGFAPRCLFAEPGVGIVISHMLADPQHARRAFASLRFGATASAALDAALVDDPDPEHRQIVVMNVRGEAAGHTGARCLGFAGHVIGVGFTAQGVILGSADVVPDTARGFTASNGSLADRLIAALEAGRDAGGDIRGEAAAGLLIVSSTSPTSHLDGHRVDIRIDRHAEPLAELRRQLQVQRTYGAMEAAFAEGLSGAIPTALEKMSELRSKNTGDPEILLRHAILLAAAGDEVNAISALERLRCVHPGWRTLVRQLPAAGFLPPSFDLLLNAGKTVER